MDSENFEAGICMLNSLFFLSNTTICITERFGENNVLYNHKSGTISPIDSKGYSVLEAGGIYSNQLITADICKNKPFSQEIKSSEVSFFKSFMGNKPVYTRRESLKMRLNRQIEEVHTRRKSGSLMKSKSNSSIGSLQQAVSESQLQQQRQYIFKRKSSTGLVENLKTSPMLETPAIPEGDGEEVDLLAMLNSPTRTDPDKESTKQRGSLSPATSVMLSANLATFNGRRQSESALKIEALLEANVGLIDGNEVKDTILKVDSQNLYIIDCQHSDICLTIPLKNLIIAKRNRKSKECELQLIYSESQLRCIVSSYQQLVSILAVVNSVAIAIPDSSHNSENCGDIQPELFTKEYEVLIQLLQKECFVEKAGTNCEKLENVTQALYRVTSVDQPLPFDISSISLEKLVERITDIHGPDHQFNLMILYTHRCFTDSTTLLKHLTARMNPITENLTAEECEWIPIIKLRTISLVYKWIKIIGVIDFINPDTHAALRTFIDSITFINTPLRHVYETEFQTLKSYLTKVQLSITRDRRSGSFATIQSNLGNITITNTTAGSPKKKLEFSAIDADDMGNVLTVKEQEAMSRISTLSLILHLWGSHKSPLISNEIRYINECVEAFNNLSYWVATEICTQPDIKNRAKIIEKFIKIAKTCLKLNNFNSTLAIVSGLNVVAVSRLKATWEIIDPKRQKQLTMIEEILSPSGNYKTYRNTIDELDVTKPCIPVFSLLLKDLLFTSDGNSTFTDPQKRYKN
ncbi:hypothetical protein HDV02_001900 [Globomyces sp. JEL0801]|nr:hypothetical protein HDV02_001900 [Globomyces sp. JEL0801]